MKCPKCGRAPVSVLEHVLMLGLSNELECRSCGARLVRGALLRRISWIAVLVGVVLGGGCIVLAMLVRWPLDTLLPAALAAAVIACAPLEYIGWKYGRYELPGPDKPAPDQADPPSEG